MGLRPRPRRQAGCFLAAVCLVAVATRAGAHVGPDTALPSHTCIHDTLDQVATTGEVAYDAHPFEASGGGHEHSGGGGVETEKRTRDAPASQPRRAATDGAGHEHSRRLHQYGSPGGGSVYAGYQPLRVALDWQGGSGQGAVLVFTTTRAALQLTAVRLSKRASTGSTLSPAALSFLNVTLLPTALAWWSHALSVYPVSQPLTFGTAGGSGLSCGPAAALTGPFASTDLVVRAYVGSVPGQSVTQPSANVAAACAAEAQECSVDILNCSAQTATCAGTTALAGSQGALTAACSAQADTCLAAGTACGAALQSCGAISATLHTTSSGTLAFTSVCHRDQYGRPVASQITFVASAVSGAASAAAAALANTSSSMAGGLAMVPTLLAEPNARFLFSITLHELGHALGFNAASVPLFRDVMSQGAPRANASTPGSNSSTSALGVGLPPSLMQLPQERMYRFSCALAPTSQVALAPDTCVFKLSTPAVLAAASAHFACDPDTLLGAELENQDTTAGAVYGSHWEMRLYADELMSAILVFQDVAVSAETLAFFADSGWYAPNDAARSLVNARKRTTGGQGQGCAFAVGGCINPVESVNAAGVTTPYGAASPSAAAAALASAPGVSLAQAYAAAAVTMAGTPPHFCTVPGAKLCTFDLRSLGTCAMANLPVVKPQFSWFWTTGTPLAGGALSQPDFCPIALPTESCASSTSSSAASSSSGVMGDVRGDDSFCVYSTLNSGANGSSAQGASATTVYVPACYTATCNALASAVTITAVDAGGNSRSVVCTTAQVGKAIQVPGFSGQLLCPHVPTICGTAPDVCAGFRWSGTTQGVGLAAAVAAGVALLIYTPLRLAVHTSACAGADDDDDDAPVPKRKAGDDDTDVNGVEGVEGTGDASTTAADTPPKRPASSAVATYVAQVLHEHPLCRLVRSFGIKAANATRTLHPGDVVQVLQYEQTPGGIALDLLLRLGTSQYLPPPPPLESWEQRMWRHSYATAAHPAWFTVTDSHERSARGAVLLRLAGCDFVATSPGADAAPRWLPLFRACGPDGPPQLTAPQTNGHDVGAFGGAPQRSPQLLQMNGNGGGPAVPTAREDPRNAVWTPYFYREHVITPLVGDMPAVLRPPAVLASGLSGKPMRRFAALLTLHGPATLFLCALEAKLLGAALQHACAPTGMAIMARAPAVAMVTCTLAYASRCSGMMWSQPELMAHRTFWLLWLLATTACCAAFLWAVALNVAAASGMQLLSSSDAPTELLVPSADSYVGYCNQADVRDCAAAAVRRIGIAWGAAILVDLCVLWPLALVMSRHVWKDGVATWPEVSDDSAQEQGGSGETAAGHQAGGRQAGPPPVAVRDDGSGPAAGYSTPVKRSNSAGVEDGNATPGSATRREALNVQSGAWN